ncbi:DNA polymerase III subunit delta [Candidatus Saccharibacteria bacterium]|nr:DNA polymerase III subunit delta [Candidatus Saccharibacteria bacterium]
MIYLYSGENDFAITEKLRAVSEAFKKKYSDASVERIDGSEISTAELSAKLTSIDMFTSRKLLVLTDMGKKKNTWDTLAQSLALVPDSTEVVIIEAKPDGRLNATREIKKVAKTTEFKLLARHELEQWTRQTVQELKLEIKNDALRLLIEFCESNQWQIMHELKKLSLITKVITSGIIVQYVEPSPGTDVFRVLEFAINKDLDVLNAALDILRQKEDVNKFLGLLTSQIFTLTALKNSPEQASVARDMGLAPFLVSKQTGLARAITPNQLNKLVASMAEIDGRVKLGEDGWLLIKLALNRLFG